MRTNQTISAFVAFIIICALSACGGGGGSPGTAETQKQPISIAMFGDSTMAGWTYPNGPGPVSTAIITPDNAPYNLQTTLQQMGLSAVVTNDGISGTAIEDLLAGRSGYQSWGTILPTLTAQIVVENYAINDTQRAYSVQDYAQYLSSWVDSVRAVGKIPVLEEPNPVCQANVADKLDAYVAEIDALAAQKKVPLIMQYAYLKSIPDWQGMLSDCVHPKPAMYEIKGRREAQVIGPLVASLGG